MKLIVISMDALIGPDLEKLMQMPTFREVFGHCAKVERLRSIYPTLTYPCHTTMVTGCLPQVHGVINNTYDLVGVEPLPWVFRHEAVKCPDLFDSCRQAGLTTAAVNWPVTGCHQSIDWLMDECWPQGTNTVEAFRETLLSLGTDEQLYEEILAPLMHLRVRRVQPDSSMFGAMVSAGIIRRHRPDLLVLHTANMDGYRHMQGVFSPLTERGLEECDTILRILVDGARDAGVWEETNIVVTSDHGQINVTRMVHLNCLLARSGLIEIGKKGEVVSWQAWCHSTAMSARIQLKDPQDKALEEKVLALLEQARDDGLWGIEKIYTREQVCQQEGLDGDFTFVLEGDCATKFGTHWTGPAVTHMPMGATGPMGASHGYHPDKGHWPVLLGAGPGFRKDAAVETARLQDTAPTYAALLGVELPQAQGRVLTQLLV